MMKVYYTSSVSHNDEGNKILEVIRKAADATRFEVKSVYTQFADLEDYRKLSDEEAYSVFRKSEKALKDADVIIADVSYSNNRIGFEIANALAEKKPVLAILKKSPNIKLTPPMQGNRSKHLKTYRYEGSQDLETAVLDFLQEAKKQVDSKFILIISPEIDKYLEWAATERRMHKAQVVRNAVEGVIAKDKDYKDYLKSRE